MGDKAGRSSIIRTITGPKIMKSTYLTILALALPLASFGDTVFSDIFENGSTINSTPTAPTSTSASYQNWTQGANPANFTIASGALHFEARNTASVFSEVQAQFASSPISLLTVGDSISLQLVFTDTSHVLLAGQNASAQLDIGLYNSGGVLPLTGSRLDAGTAATGGAAAYTGYISRFFLNGNANIINRPVQSGGANSSDQDLLFNNAGGGAFNSPTATQIGTTTATGFTTGLTQGNQYTIDLSISLTSLTAETITWSLYDGVGTGGTLLATQSVNDSSLFATSFDAFAFGWRHTGSTEPSSLTINSILIADNLAPVPEPTTIALSALGGFGLLVLRRKNQK